MDSVKTILVADASESFRQNFIEAIQNEPDLRVIAETGDGQELLDMIRQLQPDVVVMELVLGGIDGLEVLNQLDVHVP